MNAPFPAIYENGVFKPLHPVDLKEHEVVRLAVVSQEPTAASTAGQPSALAAMLDETAALPPEGPDDGFSGRDHDRVLYDWRK
jgi:predicted DNA-binding antitoxin AbrB/MazE fold protein